MIWNRFHQEMARRSFVKISVISVALFCAHITWLCHATDLLDTKSFSQVLSKLAMEGLGVGDLQVLKYTVFYCQGNPTSRFG